MYLSRLLLDPTSRQVQRETADPYNLHRTILKAFDTDRESANILHRIETNGSSGQTILLVQSDIKPNWQPLLEKAYLLPEDPFTELANPAVKEINLPLQNRQLLRFRLCANPTIKKVRRDENGNRRNSNRVPLLHKSKQIEWLQKQAQANGFRILDIGISQPEQQASRKKGNGRSITIYTVTFNGRLQISNVAKFTAAVKKGIGPAKAFGCGLLSLAPG